MLVSIDLILQHIRTESDPVLHLRPSETNVFTMVVLHSQCSIMAPVITPLIIGGGNVSGAVDAGYVKLELDGEKLSVTYKLYDDFALNSSSGDSRDDWGISKIHFDFGTEKEASFPLARNGNPQVGQFDFGGKTAQFESGYEPSSTASEVRFSVDGVDLSDLTYWAAHASVSQRTAIQAFNESLPTQVSFRLTDGPDRDGDDPETSYWEASITGSSESWLNDTFKAWCVDTGGEAKEGNSFTASVYSSIADDLTGVPVDKPLNFDRANWLLNNAQYFVGKDLTDTVKYGTGSAACDDYVNGGTATDWDLVTDGGSLGTITFGDIQRAIWGLIEGTQSTAGLGSYSLARADELADLAYIYGKGFVPECDGTVAVVLKPTSSGKQAVIGQVTMAEASYPCGGSSETGWAITNGIDGLGGNDRFGRSWAEYNTSPDLA